MIKNSKKTTSAVEPSVNLYKTLIFTAIAATCVGSNIAAKEKGKHKDDIFKPDINGDDFQYELSSGVSFERDFGEKSTQHSIDAGLSFYAAHSIGAAKIYFTSGFDVSKEKGDRTETSLSSPEIGMYLDNLEFSLGNTSYASDDFGISADQNFGRSNEFDDLSGEGDYVGLVTIEFKNTVLAISRDSELTETVDSAFLEHEFENDLKVAIALQSKAENNEKRLNAYGASIAKEFGDWTLGYSIGRNDMQTGHDFAISKELNDDTEFNVGCGFTLMKSIVNLDNDDEDDSDEDSDENLDQKTCYSNITREVNDNLSFSFETAYQKEEGQKSEYAAALEMSLDFK